MMKEAILRLLPEPILEMLKRIKKYFRNRKLTSQKNNNQLLTKEDLIDQIKNIGVAKGDHLLVHCSLSKIGYINGGALTLIEALLEAVGPEGTLLMPAFPAKGRNKDYLLENTVFELNNTPSQMGATSETFRKMTGVKRSFHPTDSVCAFGKEADYFTNSHFGNITPYNEFSPFRKLCNKHGKILMLGTTLNGACTNLHTLEDAVVFKYPVYDDQIFTVKMIDHHGIIHAMETKVHNPLWSAKRNCDALKPLFEKEQALINGKIGEATCMLIDANKMLEVMIDFYNRYGVTMYTPLGTNNELAN
ncbi:MAG: AAC(3) family N-acetyltransferase [Bacteroidota bacterium]|jgi:aminoglycoside 3-N-acetyltransferase